MWELCSRMCLLGGVFLVKSAGSFWHLFSPSFQGPHLLTAASPKQSLSVPLSLPCVMFPPHPSHLLPPVKWCRPSLHDPSLFEEIFITGGVGAALTLEAIPESAGMGSRGSVRGAPPPHTHCPLFLARWGGGEFMQEKRPALLGSRSCALILAPLGCVQALSWQGPARVHP